MMFVEGRLTRPGWLRLTWQAAAVKDAVRRQGGGLWPSLTATACHVVVNSGRDDKTALQPNQKTANKTEILLD
jgi:hypothetical protein